MNLPSGSAFIPSYGSSTTKDALPLTYSQSAHTTIMATPESLMSYGALGHEAREVNGYDAASAIAVSSENGSKNKAQRKERKWVCDHLAKDSKGAPSPCNKSFGRKADLQRHRDCVHNKNKIEMKSCPIKRCQRKGENGFKRHDHLTAHMRNYHNKDIPKRRRPDDDERLPDILTNSRDDIDTSMVDAGKDEHSVPLATTSAKEKKATDNVVPRRCPATPFPCPGEPNRLKNEHPNVAPSPTVQYNPDVRTYRFETSMSLGSPQPEDRAGSLNESPRSGSKAGMLADVVQSTSRTVLSNPPRSMEPSEMPDQLAIRDKALDIFQHILTDNNTLELGPKSNQYEQTILHSVSNKASPEYDNQDSRKSGNSGYTEIPDSAECSGGSEVADSSCTKTRTSPKRAGNSDNLGHPEGDNCKQKRIKRLFPNEEVIPSPYCPLSSKVIIDDYQHFAKSQMPRLLQEELEQELGISFDPLLVSLFTRLPSIVERCNNRLTMLYKSRFGTPASPSSDSAYGSEPSEYSSSQTPTTCSRCSNTAATSNSLTMETGNVPSIDTEQNGSETEPQPCRRSTPVRAVELQSQSARHLGRKFNAAGLMDTPSTSGSSQNSPEAVTNHRATHNTQAFALDLRSEIHDLLNWTKTFTAPEVAYQRDNMHGISSMAGS